MDRYLKTCPLCRGRHVKANAELFKGIVVLMCEDCDYIVSRYPINVIKAEPKIQSC